MVSTSGTLVNDDRRRLFCSARPQPGIRAFRDVDFENIIPLEIRTGVTYIPLCEMDVAGGFVPSSRCYVVPSQTGAAAMNLNQDVTRCKVVPSRQRASLVSTVPRPFHD